MYQALCWGNRVPGLVSVYFRWGEADNKEVNKILLGGDE